MAGTLVGFQPVCGSSSNSTSVPPANPFQRTSSSGRSAQPARSLLSELLFAAMTAEQQQQAEGGQEQPGVINQAAAQAMRVDCWMEDDACCSDDEEEDSEDEGEGSEGEDMDEGDYMLFDMLPQARSSPLPIPPPAASHASKLQAAIAQAQLAQLLHYQALHAEQMAQMQEQNRQMQEAARQNSQQFFTAGFC